jgi:hypothetical protein
VATSVEGIDDGSGFGVKGTAVGGDGVVGTTRGIHKAAIRGIHTGHISAIAVIGELDQGTAAVLGQVGGGAGGVGGDDVIGSGVWGNSSRGPGVSGTSSATGGAGVWGENPNGTGVFGKGATAGVFEGDVVVTGDIKLTGADVAEQFDVATDVPAGSVVCLDDSARVDVCRRPYDKRVAGIVSGLGDRRPAVVLDRTDRGPRRPVAVVGKAWCLADAQVAPIEVGDLLTTSERPGHAMAAREPGAAFGAVIGKALTPLASGCGMVLVLVGLG